MCWHLILGKAAEKNDGVLKRPKWLHWLYSSQFLQLCIIAQQRLSLEVPHKEVYTAPLTEMLFWTLLRCNCCLIASPCGSSMLEGPWAVPFEIFKIAFHARHVCLIDIALFLPLSLQALCRFLGNVPYPPTKCHTISSKSSRKLSECQNEKEWKTVRWACQIIRNRKKTQLLIPGAEDYCTEIKKKTTFQL